MPPRLVELYAVGAAVEVAWPSRSTISGIPSSPVRSATPPRADTLLPPESTCDDRCGGATWVPGVVVRHDFPAVWVRTFDGREWYVTSGKRIRARSG